MFASPAQAATGAAPAGAALPAWVSILPWIAILAIFYLLMIRPQQQRMKQHRAMIDAVKPRDTVVTSGGLIGKVTKVDDSEVEIEIAQSVRVKVMKAMLSEVRPHGAKAAND
ncbi:MAG: preprotein translocase subunit YajC [Sphingomonadales bacterium]|jgi:preprotein translocase subunit YajC|nr:preprotein translocase subunit YajC [Sphingomonadales bacterium]MEA3044013.1 preprotein translocase subunit YajC [Sphingomonadales bacterium]MEA3047824.1 preprotein translocase subunit YajC [Sphingomonadales bacterium]